MTTKDFFITVIKIFGLFSVVTSLFSVLPGNISFALMGIDLISISWILISISIVIGLFVLLVFKADKVVAFFRLDKGFDSDTIEFGNLGTQDIIKIGTFIIGGILVLQNTPSFLSHTLFAFKGDIVGIEYETQEKFNWAVSGLNLIIGYLLFTNYDIVAKRLSIDSRKG